MRLLLVVTLGFIALATAMAQEAEEFEVFYNETLSGDLDVDKMDVFEESGKVERVVRALLGSNAAEHALAGVKNVPAAYTAALQSGAEPMFDESCASNSEKVRDENAFEGEIEGGSSASGEGNLEASSRSTTCPHKTFLLRWFFLRYKSYTYAFCFVPWARLQRTYYARCRRPNCRKRLYRPRSTCCRLSCYERRRVLVYCYHFYRGYFFWNWATRNLPRRCRCSFCPGFITSG